MKNVAALPLALLCALMATACGTPPQPGYVGPGCYDHKGLLEPTIRTPGECSAASWVWRAVAPLPAMQVDAGPLTLIAGGLLVGFGVRMGYGCTSGHGVCGLSRFSPRSLVNVLAFMGAGGLTVYLTRHVL